MPEPLDLEFPALRRQAEERITQAFALPPDAVRTGALFTAGVTAGSTMRAYAEETTHRLIQALEQMEHTILDRIIPPWKKTYQLDRILRRFRQTPESRHSLRHRGRLR